MAHLTMSFTSDLVLSFKLDADFHADYIEHVYDDGEDLCTKRWKRVRRLGAGGGSEAVWLEEELVSREERALKQITSAPRLRSTLSCSRELLAMANFKRRRRHFVELFGWFESTDSIFIAMEYFPLGDLESQLNNDSGPLALPENEACQITRQILEGLKFMHSERFTHRDIKPKNLLVQSKGPNWHIKIGDFGISKKVVMNETALRTEFHTPGYGAPEIVNFDSDRETSDYTNAVDLWCVGITTFRMLAGELPFPDDSTVIKYEQGKDSFPSEHLRARNTSDRAVIFVQWLLSVIPSHRPSVDLALRHAWLSDITTSTIGSPPLSQISAWQLPLRSVPASMVGQAIGIPQVTNGTSSQSPQRLDDEDRTITSSQSSRRLYDEGTINARSQRASIDALAQNRVSIENQAADSPPSLRQRHRTDLQIQAERRSTLLACSPTTMSNSSLWASNIEIARVLDRRTFSPEWFDLESGAEKPLLWWAVASRDLVITSQLLRIPEIDVNARDPTHGWSGLAKSVIDGDVEMCQLLLQQPRINPNLRDDDWGLTPLMIAAADGHVTMVQLLLRHHLIDVNLTDARWGRTALSWAAGHGQRETVQLLLQHPSISITMHDAEGKSPLAWAVDGENLQVVQELRIHQPANNVDRDFRGRTPLWRAAGNGNTRITRFLLALDQGRSEVTDRRGHTLLIAAAGRGHRSIVSELLFPGLNGNAIHSNLRWKDANGQNALIHAAKSGHNELVELILTSVSARERRNIIDDVDNHSRTALSWAAAEGHVLAIRTLLQRGSRSTNIPDDQDQVPLHKAIRGGHEGVAAILLRSDPLTGDLKDAEGRTPLSWAASQGALETLNLLLSLEIDVNSWDNKKCTVAHWAAVYGNQDCLTALFSHASFRPYDLDGHTLWTRMIATEYSEDDKFPKEWWSKKLHYLSFNTRDGQVRPFIDVPDTRGRTPLSWAAQNGNKEFARLLLRSGLVNPSSPDNTNWTPMSYAIFCRHQLIATWLYNHQDLHPWDQQEFWRCAPRWAVRDRILSKMFPGIHPKVKQDYQPSGRVEHLTDRRTFQGTNSTGDNVQGLAEIMINELSPPKQTRRLTNS